MMRHILDETRLHPAIRDTVSANHRDIVGEVAAAVDRNRIVVVGMAQNPYCHRARMLLNASKTPYLYLEYGSYLTAWRRRNALKMWTGWPTFPMAFVKRQLVGGSRDLDTLIQSGELDKLLGDRNG